MFIQIDIYIDQNIYFDITTKSGTSFCPQIRHTKMEQPNEVGVLKWFIQSKVVVESWA